MRAWISALVALTVLGSVGGFGPAGSQAATGTSLTNQTPDELRTGIDRKHPAAYYALAKRLFEAGKRDEAVFWFYAGQLRYRSYLSSNPNLKPDGDPALFGALSEVIGRPINVYAFGDIPGLAQTIERVLAWDAAHEDTYSPRGAARDRVRAGLAEMKDDIVANAARYRATRAANGLENRTR